MKYIARVVDFETTGEAPPAEVCEVGLCDVVVEDGAWPKIGDRSAYLCGVSTMPPEARAVHHITRAECAGHGPFDQSGLRLHECFVMVAHNAAFELQFVDPTRPVLCTYKAALRAWPEAPSHGNTALAYWLEDSGLLPTLGAAARPTHRAGPDAYVSAHILLALLGIGIKAAEMVRWTREPAMLPRCPIGRDRGKPWADVEAGFLEWMLTKPDMDGDLQWNARQELNRRHTASGGLMTR